LDNLQDWVIRTIRVDDMSSLNALSSHGPLK
jgi:hypothetical protein